MAGRGCRGGGGGETETRTYLRNGLVRGGGGEGGV